MDAPHPVGAVIVLVAGVVVFAAWSLRDRRGSTILRQLDPPSRRAADRAPSVALVRVVSGARHRLGSRRRARRGAFERRRSVPLLAEMIRMGVAAGLPPAGALRHASPWIQGEAGTEVRRVVGDLEAGLSLREALDDLRRRAPEFRGVARILQSSAELGTEIGSALGRLARDEREALRRSAEARARTVPVRLLFPLVFLVLPAFVLLGVVPALLAGSPA